MSNGFDEAKLVERAVGGDQDALTAAFWHFYGRIHGVLKRRIPADCKSLIDADDVIQVTFEEAFRTIGKFEDRGDNSFFGWLSAIAKLRLKDQVKAIRAKKRPDPRKRIRKRQNPARTTAASILGVLAVNDHTPSRSVARRERERALIAALAGLKNDYREALELRYLYTLPVAKIAQRMNRTERAVHMLCNRGLKKLRERMESASHFLTG